MVEIFEGGGVPAPNEQEQERQIDYAKYFL